MNKKNLAKYMSLFYEEEKNLLKEKFPQIYSKDKTEWQIMQELGYDRIWDCGKYRYEVKF